MQSLTVALWLAGWLLRAKSVLVQTGKTAADLERYRLEESISSVDNSAPVVPKEECESARSLLAVVERCEALLSKR